MSPAVERVLVRAALIGLAPYIVLACLYVSLRFSLVDELKERWVAASEAWRDGTFSG